MSDQPPAARRRLASRRHVLTASIAHGVVGPSLAAGPTTMADDTEVRALCDAALALDAAEPVDAVEQWDALLLQVSRLPARSVGSLLAKARLVRCSLPLAADGRRLLREAGPDEHLLWSLVTDILALTADVDRTSP